MKKLTAMCLCVFMLIAWTPSLGASASSSVPANGKAGECSWEFDGSTLTISGSGHGQMWKEDQAWNEYKLDIKNLVILDGVSSICERAFSGCTNLSNVKIAESVKRIGREAFNSTGILKKSENWENGVLYIDNCLIKVNNGEIPADFIVKDKTRIIAAEAFQGGNVTSITIPESLTNVGSTDFYSCSRLSRINITNLESWCSIEYDSYGEGCITPLMAAHNLYLNGEKVVDLVIPKGVTEIQCYAFAGGDFKSVKIPKEIEYVGTNAFLECANLMRVDIEDMNAWLNIDFTCDGFSCYGGHCSNPLFYAHDLYLNNEKVSQVRIPDSITKIKASFPNCIGLKSVTMPNSVTSISDCAFSNCTGLTSITTPNSVTSIGERAFSGCTGLTSITTPNSVTSIGERAFSGCVNLCDVTIPGNADIGWRAFDDCNIKKLTYTEGTTKVNSLDIFQDTGSLETIIIPNSVTIVTLAECNQVKNVTIPQCIASGSYKLKSLFPNCEHVTIDSTTKRIGEGAFEDCFTIKEIIIPDSVSNIGNFAFNNCTGLEYLSIPGGVKTIGVDAFYNCSAILHVVRDSFAHKYAIHNQLTYIATPGEYDHTGGTATCVKKAVCKICNEEYGTVDENNHVNTSAKAGTAVASTCTEQGHKDDIYCDDCHKKVADGDTLPLDPTNHKGTTSIVNEKAFRI